MRKCCFIIPYFGRFPNYFNLFLKSCEKNKNYQWLIFTDANVFDSASNISIVRMPFSELKNRINKKFGFEVNLERAYKLCDLKPAYGFIFEEFIDGFDYWGHCDVDTIMGNLDHFLPPLFDEGYDKIFCLGHMTIYKNTFVNNRIFMEPYKNELLYKTVFTSRQSCFFDEDYKDDRNVNSIFKEKGRKIYSKDVSLNFEIGRTKFVKTTYEGWMGYRDNHGYRVEIPKDALCIWENGCIFRFYKENGVLKREEFAYVHLQRRKMEVLVNDSCHSFKIVPNSFRNIEYNGEITSDTFGRIKRRYLCLHWFQLKLPCYLKKIKAVFRKE